MHLLILLMTRVLFTFLLKLNSHHPYTFTPHLQQTLKQNHRALHNFYRVKNMLKLLAFKWPLNKLLLEKEWSEFMLIWWFVSIRFIKLYTHHNALWVKHATPQKAEFLRATSLSKLDSMVSNNSIFNTESAEFFIKWLVRLHFNNPTRAYNHPLQSPPKLRSSNLVNFHLVILTKSSLRSPLTLPSSIPT